MISECKGFWGLLIFGNIENLILASQGATSHVNPIILLALSLICVVIWLLAGKFGTQLAIKYADEIEIIGGLAIVILGLQSMLEATGII
ncbi:MAG: hypothetical protein BZ137_09315 [Methanosphaera sp. rholeuAM130]|nr:hypothetical protein [Methanosphaera sp.]RAP52039.1 MAG: hypothetical protein BZ137_09315 [Methanosphaera sp. rholeuAM130]